MRIKHLVKLYGSILLLGTSSLAVANEDIALTILKNIDVTSFRNSLGPKHLATGTKLSQTEFNIFTTQQDNKDTYYATDKNKNFEYSVRILTTSKNETFICFGDHALKGTGNIETALTVQINSDGAYIAKPTTRHQGDCEISQ